MGVDIVELDLKKTKDGVVVIMHDGTIDRTTNGKGKPADCTFEKIRKFGLKNGIGRVTRLFLNRKYLMPILKHVIQAS
jgi:glycerophosphoryl diester phosphodiesterase